MSLLFAKRASAFALMACLFLPLYQCTTISPERERRVEIRYAYNAYSWPSFGAVLAIASFIWPIIFILTTAVRPTIEDNGYFCAMEFVLCLGSAYMLTTMFLISTKILIGGYIAASSLLIHFLIVTSACIRRFHGWRIRRRTQ